MGCQCAAREPGLSPECSLAAIVGKVIATSVGTHASLARQALSARMAFSVSLVPLKCSPTILVLHYVRSVTRGKGSLLLAKAVWNAQSVAAAKFSHLQVMTFCPSRGVAVIVLGIKHRLMAPSVLFLEHLLASLLPSLR